MFKTGIKPEVKRNITAVIHSVESVDYEHVLEQIHELPNGSRIGLELPEDKIQKMRRTLEDSPFKPHLDKPEKLRRMLSEASTNSLAMAMIGGELFGQGIIHACNQKGHTLVSLDNASLHRKQMKISNQMIAATEIMKKALNNSKVTKGFVNRFRKKIERLKKALDKVSFKRSLKISEKIRRKKIDLSIMGLNHGQDLEKMGHVVNYTPEALITLHKEKLEKVFKD